VIVIVIALASIRKKLKKKIVNLFHFLSLITKITAKSFLFLSLFAKIVFHKSSGNSVAIQ